MEINSKEELLTIIKQQDEKINSMSTRLEELISKEPKEETKQETNEETNEETKEGNEEGKEIDEKQVDEIEQMFSQN